MQQEMRGELTARKTKMTARLTECKQTKETLSGQQYVIDDTSGPSVLLNRMDEVTQSLEARNKELEKSRSKCAKVAFNVLESSDIMWRALKRLERSVLAVEVAAAGTGGSGSGEVAAFEKRVFASAAMMSAEAAADEANLRSANTTGKWEPLQLLESYSQRIGSIYKFFQSVVPAAMVDAQPSQQEQQSMRKVSSENNLRLDKYALEEATNLIE